MTNSNQPGLFRLTYRTTDGDIARTYFPYGWTMDRIREEAHNTCDDFYQGISIVEVDPHGRTEADIARLADAHTLSRAVNA